MNRPRIKTRRVALAGSTLGDLVPLARFVVLVGPEGVDLGPFWGLRPYVRTRVRVPACVPASTPAPVRVVSLGPLSGNS